MTALLSCIILILICSLAFGASVANQFKLFEAVGVAYNDLSSFSENSIRNTCVADSDCSEAQKCVARKHDEPGLEPCTSGETSCTCLTVIPCNSNADCGTGKVCAPGLDVNTCIREERASLSANNRQTNDTLLHTQISYRKLSFEEYSRTEECSVPRTCRVIKDSKIEPCNGRKPCSCLNRRPGCRFQSDCDVGDRCRGRGSSFFCVSSRLPGYQQNHGACLSNSLPTHLFHAKTYLVSIAFVELLSHLDVQQAICVIPAKYASYWTGKVSVFLKTIKLDKIVRYQLQVLHRHLLQQVSNLR